MKPITEPYDRWRSRSLERTARYLLEKRGGPYGPYGDATIAYQLMEQFPKDPELHWQFVVELLGLQTEEARVAVEAETQAVWDEALFWYETEQDPEQLDARTRAMHRRIALYGATGQLDTATMSRLLSVGPDASDVHQEQIQADRVDAHMGLPEGG